MSTCSMNEKEVIKIVAESEASKSTSKDIKKIK
jgi:hypothetical protein